MSTDSPGMNAVLIINSNSIHECMLENFQCIIRKYSIQRYNRYQSYEELAVIVNTIQQIGCYGF